MEAKGRLSLPAVNAALVSLPGWSLDDGGRSIKKQYVFPDFQSAWAFMSSLTDYINSTDHHPEWENVYNKVKVRLTTHDDNGVTDKDIALASLMETNVKKFNGK